MIYMIILYHEPLLLVTSEDTTLLVPFFFVKYQLLFLVEASMHRIMMFWNIITSFINQKHGNPTIKKNDSCHKPQSLKRVKQLKDYYGLLSFFFGYFWPNHGHDHLRCAPATRRWRSWTPPSSPWRGPRRRANGSRRCSGSGAVVGQWSLVVSSKVKESSI